MQNRVDYVKIFIAKLEDVDQLANVVERYTTTNSLEESYLVTAGKSAEKRTPLLEEYSIQLPEFTQRTSLSHKVLEEFHLPKIPTGVIKTIAARVHNIVGGTV